MSQSADTLAVRIAKSAAELRRLAGQTRFSVAGLAQAARGLGADFDAIHHLLTAGGSSVQAIRATATCPASRRHDHHGPKGEGHNQAAMADELCGLDFISSHFAHAERVVVEPGDDGVLVADAHTADGTLRLEVVAIAQLFEMLAEAIHHHHR